MNIQRTLGMLMSIGAGLASSAAGGVLLSPVEARHSVAYSSRTGANLLTTNGMDATGAYLGTSAGDNVLWHIGNSSANAVSVTNALTAQKIWVVLDLGDVYSLASIRLWNFQWNHSTLGDLSDRGLKTVDVYVRNAAADTDTGLVGGVAINTNGITATSLNQFGNAQPFALGTSNPWQLLLADQPLARAPNQSTYAGEAFGMSNVTARFIALVGKTFYGSSTGGAGLGKVRVYANTLARYELTVPGGANTNRLPVTVADPLVTAGNFELYQEGALASATNAIFISSTTHRALMRRDQTGTTITPVVTSNYFSFKVTPSSDYAMTLQNLQFTYTISLVNPLAPTSTVWHGCEVYSSLNAFTTPVGTNLQLNAYFNQANALSFGLEGISNITKETEFRFYFKDGSSDPGEAYHAVDTVQLSGTLTKRRKGTMISIF